MGQYSLIDLRIIFKVSSMNLDLLITSILENTSTIKEQNIRNMSQKLVGQIGQLDEIEKDKKTAEEKHLLEAFFKILESIAGQVQAAKKKYENLDKEKMKQQKCIALAKDIKIFKEECFYLRDKLAVAKEELKSIKIDNEIIEQQQQMLEKVYDRKSKQKEDIKFKTLSQFWVHSKKKEKVKEQNQTQLEFRTDKANDSSQVLQRFISTSQQPRRYGKSLDVQKSSSYSRIKKRKFLNIKNLSNDIQ